MKRLFSKRSGFTLVEIIIAFAIFAIMASMIVQVLNLMVRRKVRNRQFEDNLAIQEEAFIARSKNMDYNKSAEADGQLTFQFKDKDDSALTVEPIDFQLKNWDPDNSRNGINYFAGDYEYVLAGEGTEYTGAEDPDKNKNPSTLGGSSQMSWFDTRITGTKGINEIKVQVTSTSEPNVVNVTVEIDDSGVESLIYDHAQVSLFFAEGKPNGKSLKVKRVSKDGDYQSLATLLSVKPCGDNGVNIHTAAYSTFSKSPVTFTVEFDEDVDVADIGFGEGDNVNGSDITGGVTYSPYTVTIEDKDGNKTTATYVNLFGAYPKDDVAPSTPGGEGDPEE